MAAARKRVALRAIMTAIVIGLIFGAFRDMRHGEYRGARWLW